MTDPVAPIFDPIEAARKFDEAVRATSVIGSLVTDVANVKTLAVGIDGKVDLLLAKSSREDGERHAVTVLISFIVSLATIGTGLAGWLTFFAPHTAP